MNLGVVYELRDRLKTAAVAGVGLIQDDFRLKRSVEQMAPLSKASPVFGRIFQMAEKTIAPDCENRAQALLDTLALVDAVLCTQGSLLKDSQWEEIVCQGDGGEICTNVPYSQLAPVLEAFGGTGSGRYGVLLEARERNPEIFKDYRVKNLMVKALGDSYGELADMAASWLREEGERILPLLKRGFDPAGKRDMVRRVEIIEAIRAEAENDFYLEMLPKAGKEVKEAVVRALRHDSDNEAVLLDLVKAEKGKVKEAALISLTCMNGENAEEFWKKQMKKNPVKTAGYLANSSAMWASDLIGEQLEGWLDTFDQSQIPFKKMKEEDKSILYSLWGAARGKHSPRLCRCYERVYQVIPKETAEVLWDSLLEEREPLLCRTAEDMYKKYGDGFLQSVFWISLLTKKPGEVYDRFAPYLTPDKALDVITGLGKEKRDPMGIYKALMHVRYEEKEGCYVAYREPLDSPFRFRSLVSKLEEGLDLKWYPLLLKSKDRFNSCFRKWGREGFDNTYDTMMAELFRPDVEELKEEYGKYFYQGAKLRGTLAADARMLKKCGWTDYKGLLALTGKKNTQLMTYEVRELLGELPLSSQELGEELDQLIKSYGKKAKMGIGVLELWRDKLKSGIRVEDL